MDANSINEIAKLIFRDITACSNYLNLALKTSWYATIKVEIRIIPQFRVGKVISEAELVH